MFQYALDRYLQEGMHYQFSFDPPSFVKTTEIFLDNHMNNQRNCP
jgi:hypothetical protein